MSQPAISEAIRQLERDGVAAGDEGDIATASTQNPDTRFIPTLLGRLGNRIPRPDPRHEIGSLPDVIKFVEGGIATIGFACYAPAGCARARSDMNRWWRG